MSNRTLLTIYTWSGDRDRITRNMPTWVNRGADIQFVSPINEPCHLGGITCFQSQQFGGDLMRRIRAGMAHALSRDYFSYIFSEADSIVLRNIPTDPPNKDGLNCFCYENRDPTFKASVATHFAWWMSRSTLATVHSKMLNYDMSLERGFADRTLSFILEKEGIPIHHCPLYIYSANELSDESHYRDIAERKETLVFVHGVKTQDHLDKALKAAS